MKPDQRVVTKVPLTELWDVPGVLEYTRGRVLGVPEITTLLRVGGLRLVVAEPGAPLRWVSEAEAFDFWKSDAKARCCSVQRNCWLSS